MRFYPSDRSHHEREERLDALGARTVADPALQAIWALDDRLRAIGIAEQILRRGHMVAVDHYRVSAALNGRSPEEARAAARAQFERDYGRAVAAERIAA
jgi:hypothetical protein